ncbi:winged helix-turn-helix domain-containing protein [Vibrio sp. 16]|uniref:winged helix-turn-helix domain-containing protein n=1 Tax=Vibrio sp. 16 TaxID=391586 RepID=UPI002FF041B0
MQAIQFSNLTLECATRTLRNQNGNKIVLRPLPYEVLLLLLQAKEPVSREELFAQCWEGTIVTDQALTNVICGLRRNLLSLKAKGTEITTISKVGYYLQTDAIDIQCLDERVEDSLNIEETTDIKPKASSLPFWKQKVIQPYILGAVFMLTTLVTLLLLFYSKPLVTKPSYIKKHNYEHFSNGDTNYYLNDMTGGFIGVFELKQQLAALVPTICGADVYIRLYPSLYEPDQVTLTVWLQQATGKRNHMFHFFHVDKHQLARNIVGSLDNKEVRCELH